MRGDLGPAPRPRLLCHAHLLPGPPANTVWLEKAGRVYRGERYTQYPYMTELCCGGRCGLTRRWYWDTLASCTCNTNTCSRPAN